MSRFSFPHIVLQTATRVYRCMHVVYPPDFRQAYGEEMTQVFRTACRETLSESGGARLVGLWLHTLVDLIATASRERSMALLRRENILRGVIAVFALVAASLARHLHSQTDADQTALVIILGGAFLWGTVWPDRGWWRVLLIGFGVVALALVGYGLSLGGVPSRDFDAPSPLTSIPLLLGGYAGALVSWWISRRTVCDTVRAR